MSEPIRQQIKAEYDGKGVDEFVADLDIVQASVKETADRSKVIDKLESELHSLAIAEAAYQQRVEQGRAVTQLDIAGSERRREQMRRIGAELGAASEVQARANRLVAESVSGSATATTAASGLAGGWDKVTTSVKGAVLGIVGAGGLLSALELASARLRENAELTNQLKDAQLDLQFLNQGYRPDELALVREGAEYIGGKDALLKTSAAFSQFKSQTSGLSDEERNAYFRELLETSLTTSASPTDLVELFTKGSLYVSDPNRLQNIIRKTQELSPESSPKVLASLLPRVLPVGEQAGLAPEQTAGLLVTAINSAGEPSEGATAIRNIILGLKGQQTPEGAELLGKLGVSRDRTVIDQLELLAAAQRTGKLDLGGLQTLFGQGNAAVAAGLLKNFDDAQSNVRQIVGVGQSDVDLTAEAIRNIYGEDIQQRYRLQTRQAEARIAAVRSSDTRAQHRELVGKLVEEQIAIDQARGELSPYRGDFNRKGYDVLTGFGVDPEKAARYGMPGDIGDRAIEQLNQGPKLDASDIGRPNNILGPDLELDTKDADPLDLIRQTDGEPIPRPDQGGWWRWMGGPVTNYLIDQMSAPAPVLGPGLSVAPDAAEKLAQAVDKLSGVAEQLARHQQPTVNVGQVYNTGGNDGGRSIWTAMTGRADV